MSEPTMNHQVVSLVGKHATAEDHIGYIPPVAKSGSTVLHENCKGCEHIRANRCPYVYTPRQRKWPCFFREHVTVKTDAELVELSSAK
jgi:hypothetical protein